jgi:lipopolysaccharide export system protein LptA
VIRAIVVGTLALVPGVAPATESALRPVSIGVAPFEQVAPPGEVLPQVSSLLARRLATLGIARVVGPEQLGATALAEPDASEVRGWASDANVAAVVVGRMTRVGSQLSVDVRLRSGATGDVAQTYVAEIARPDQVDSAVEGLAGQIADGAGDLFAVNSPPPPVSGTAERAGGGHSFGLGSFDRDAPLTIRSDSLDAFQDDGERRLVFSQNVKATQADLTITSDRLEALYPDKATQPSRLVAEGRVVAVRGRHEARCDRATYERSEQRLVCRGNAELREGGDRVTGAQIEFDIESERVVVSGGASIVIQPSGGDAEGGGSEGASR